MKNFISRLKDKKGMNAVETAILVIILLMLIIIYVDVLMVSQKMSAATAVSNYLARTIERQGGMLDYVPTNFATYGHGSYTTSGNAYKLINSNLERTFGGDALGNSVEIKIKLVQSDPSSRSEPNQGIEVIHFDKDSCFGIYLKGKGDFSEGSDGFISTKSLKYYKPYYIVVVTMKYNMWIVPSVLSQEDYEMTKSFSRIVVPSYYIQEEGYNDTDTDNNNFFVV